MPGPGSGAAAEPQGPSMDVPVPLSHQIRCRSSCSIHWLSSSRLIKGGSGPGSTRIWHLLHHIKLCPMFLIKRLEPRLCRCCHPEGSGSGRGPGMECAWLWAEFPVFEGPCPAPGSVPGVCQDMSHSKGRAPAPGAVPGVFQDVSHSRSCFRCFPGSGSGMERSRTTGTRFIQRSHKAPVQPQNNPSSTPERPQNVPSSAPEWPQFSPSSAPSQPQYSVLKGFKGQILGI